MQLKQALPNSLHRSRSILLLVVLALAWVPISVCAAEPAKLAAPPLGERWFSVNLSGERVGFAHQVISQAAEGYRIESDGSVRMQGLGFSRDSASRESYLVGRDLAIKSFTAETRVEGTLTALKGEAAPAGIKVTAESKGSRKERTLKVKGSVFPSQALNLYPLMQGGTAGKTYKLQMFDAEAVKVKQVKVETVGPEQLPDGSGAIHLRNNLFPIVDNDIWVDLQGNTVKESVRDDMVLTLAESEASARGYLEDVALFRSDLTLDFSLVRVTPPLERPTQLKKLVVDFSGFPQDFPLLQGKGQQATRLPGGTIRFSMPNPAWEQLAGGKDQQPGELEPMAQPSGGSPEIIGKKDQIVGEEKDPARIAKLLIDWVAKEIKGSVADNKPPLEALKSGSGSCRTHTMLYLALSRAAGIPTRMVSGLTYAAGKGFFYHSWAECNLNGAWVPVDPSLGEMPANPTHIKLAEGETGELGNLAGVIGRIQAKAVEPAY